MNNLNKWLEQFNTGKRDRLLLEGLLRTVLDVLMINLALILALALRYLWIVGFESDLLTISARDILRQYIDLYFDHALIVTLVSLIVFYISGFYTHGRFYTGRYKALVVTQAVSVSYLALAALTFFTDAWFRLPRGVLVISWALTLFMLLGARLWSLIWVTVIKREPKLEPKRKVSRVLVIGGAGYIGSSLLPRLLDKGYKVRLLDLMLYGEEPIADLIGHPNLEIMHADFRQIDKVVEAARDVEAVIHLGGIVGDPACALDENLTIDVNLMATRMIAEVVKGSGIHRFIFASTCSVYGAKDDMLDERSALNPVSLYARSKIASEKVLLRLADTSFSPTILRFGTIYGLSGRVRFDLVVNLLTAKALFDGEITVFGGDQWRPFLHVEDAARSVFMALEAPQPLVHAQIFNVGSNEENYTIQGVGELIKRLVPQAELKSMGRDGDRRNYRVNFNKIRTTLGFDTEWTVERGVKQVIEAVRSGRITSYRDPKFSNVAFLTEESNSSLMVYEGDWARDLIAESMTPP